MIARDEMGNALGGIRTPQIEAPVGTYYGTSPCNPGTLGFLAGLYMPFDAATLARLYPTHDVYVAKVTASANQAVADGFMLQDDAQTLINEATLRRSAAGGPLRVGRHGVTAAEQACSDR